MTLSTEHTDEVRAIAESLGYGERDARRLVRELYRITPRACGCDEPGDGCSDCLSESPIITDYLGQRYCPDLVDRLIERAGPYYEGFGP